MSLPLSRIGLAPDSMHLRPSSWQRPPPLPQHDAASPCGRGPKPPASARPAHGGASHPPGRALACRGAGCAGSGWKRSAWSGGNAVRFLVPAFRRIGGLRAVAYVPRPSAQWPLPSGWWCCCRAVAWPSPGKSKGAQSVSSAHSGAALFRTLPAVSSFLAGRPERGIAAPRAAGCGWGA